LFYEINFRVVRVITYEYFYAMEKSDFFKQDVRKICAGDRKISFLTQASPEPSA